MLIRLLVLPLLGAALNLPPGCSSTPPNPCGNGETIESTQAIGPTSRGFQVAVTCLNRGGQTHVQTVYLTFGGPGKSDDGGDGD